MGTADRPGATTRQLRAQRVFYRTEGGTGGGIGAPWTVKSTADAWWGKIDNVRDQTAVPLFLDANWIDIWPHETDLPAADITQGWRPPLPQHNTEQLGRAYFARHRGEAINLSFVDGHGEAVNIDELWSYQWSQTFVPKDTP